MFDKFIYSISKDGQSHTEQPRFFSAKLSHFADLKKLDQIVPGLEVQFDRYGEVRHLTMGSSAKLVAENSPEKNCCSLVAGKDPALLANAFLSNPIIKSLLGIRFEALSLTGISSFSFGNRVDFKQVAKVAQIDRDLTVRGGTLNITMDKAGRIFNITSTLRHGSVLAWPRNIISRSKAIDLAKRSFAQATCAIGCQFMLSAHAGRLEPVYEVTLFGRRPTNAIVYLILAATGTIVDQETLVLRSAKTKGDRRNCSAHAKELPLAALNIPASALLQTPDPNRPIVKQVSDTIIRCLPNADILASEYLILLMGSKGKPVHAKSDGSYCYRPNEPEFAAVTTFVSLNSQIALYLALGMKKPDRPLVVFVNDKTVVDNAYFNPNRYELHIGVGSGLKGNGLSKHMSFDLGIANHEFGHNVVYLQTPSHDLPGLEGSAIHEAIGDVLGTLVMHYLVKIWYAKQLGCAFSVADIKADQRIIGSYAAAPMGIRSQKNNRRMPQDFVAEAHTDGLIIGGALSDLLVDMATKANTNLEDQIRLFVKITLLALVLVPGHKVTFTDVLRAMLTADKEITKGTYRQNIEQCFARHGITLGATAFIRTKPRALAA